VAGNPAYPRISKLEKSMTNIIDQERLDLTSASNAAADALCPGRHLAQRGLPKRPNKEAKIGERIHLAFSGQEVTLSNHEEKLLNRAREIEFSLYHQWNGTDKSDPLLQWSDVFKCSQREVRLWAHVDSKPVHSGKVDSFWLSGDFKRALVEDLKSLFGDVEDADSNAQLRDEAALLFENYGCQEVSVFINQPGVRWKFEEQKIVTYKEKDLKRAHAEMLARVKASNTPGAARVPGMRQCAYCLSRGTTRCPESVEIVSSITTQPHLSALTPEQRGERIELLKCVTKLCKDELDLAKAQMMVDAAYATGWKLGEGRKTRKIGDIILVGSRLRDEFGAEKVTPQDVTALCTLSVTKLEEFYKARTGLKGKALADAFYKIFGDAVTVETGEPSITRAK
jgi:hypothetical protein